MTNQNLNFANAILEIKEIQRKTQLDIKGMRENISVIAQILLSEQNEKRSRNSISPIRQNWPQTIFGMIILALVVLTIILNNTKCSRNVEFYIPGDGGPHEIDATEHEDHIDTDDLVDTDTDDLVDTDSDDLVDTDTDDLVDTDTDELDCPWECLEIKNPTFLTCDEDFNPIDTDEIPTKIRNRNYQCPENHWCCQPWPAMDEKSIKTECNDRCLMSCMPDDKIEPKQGCFHPETICCTQKGDGK